MDMAFSSLLQTVMTMITPFLPYLEKGAGKVVEEVGKKAGSELWDAVQPALEARPAAREAAADLVEDPGDEQALTVVGYQLKKALQADPDLLATVRALVEKAAPSMTATVHGGGAVAQGPGAMSVGAEGTIVTGSVQGDLVISRDAEKKS